MRKYPLWTWNFKSWNEFSNVQTNRDSAEKFKFSRCHVSAFHETSRKSKKLENFLKAANFHFSREKNRLPASKKKRKENFAIGRQPKTTGFYKTRKENRKRGKLSYYRPDLRSPSVLNLKTRKENRLNEFAFHCVCFCFNSCCFH